jgi:hypothetical protein
VFHVSTSITIHAPTDHVWNTLLDFGAYGEWNPFVREQLVTDSNGTPLDDQTLHPNAYISMKTQIPPTLSPQHSPRSTRCKVTVVDNENYRVAWVYDVLPTWLLATERWQILTEVEIGGEKVTRYESREVFSGSLAYFVKWFMQAKLKLAFDVMGTGLKERSEATT